MDKEERTNVPNIYAIGDVNNVGYQLTPLAIEAGKNLARRLYTADDCQVSVPSEILQIIDYNSGTNTRTPLLVNEKRRVF